MENKPETAARPNTDPRATERKAKERLARPPKDKREVTIGPTNGTGPDVTLG